MTIQRDPDILAKKQEKVSQVYHDQISDLERSEEEPVVLTIQRPPLLFCCWYHAYFVEQSLRGRDWYPICHVLYAICHALI